jgi:ABC-2 type transport system ATP-binding protein
VKHGAAPTPVLRLAEVSKAWAGTPVLDRVDLELRAGAVVGVTGSNGAGKTTLLRIASGIIMPDSGEVLFRGEDIERRRQRFQSHIGVLSAGDRGLYARLTVQQNLDFWGGLAGFSKAQRQRRGTEVIGLFELTELAERRVDRLSMGQRQRVRLAMTFLHEPTLLFLDEPRTSLDDHGVALLARALDELLDAGGAALWVAPDEREPLLTEHWVLEGASLRQSAGRTFRDVGEPALAAVATGGNGA